MEKLYEIKNLKHDMIHDLIAKIDTISVEEAGERVDMIKDLAEAEEKCLKAHYYAEIIEAMDEAEERSGYDRYRKANGQYASKGTGTRMRGYTPTYEYDGRIMPSMMHIPFETRMGYPSSQTGRTHTYNTGNTMPSMPKYYHESEEHMMHEDYMADPEHHVDEMVNTMRGIWAGASHDQKKKMKSEISALLAEMAL